MSLRQRIEIEGSDLVAAVWIDGELNVLVLSRAIGIGEVEGDGDGIADVGHAAVDGMDGQRSGSSISVAPPGRLLEAASMLMPASS